MYFPDAPERSHRRPSDTKHKVLRAVGAGLFAISAFIGVKHGVEAMTEDKRDNQLVAATSPANRISSEQAHLAARNAVDRTISGMSDVMYGVGGSTLAIGIGVLGLATRASRRERETVPNAQFIGDTLDSPYSDPVFEEQPPETLTLTLETVEPQTYPTTAQVSFDALDRALRDPAKPIYC